MIEQILICIPSVLGVLVFCESTGSHGSDVAQGQWQAEVKPSLVNFFPGHHQARCTTSSHAKQLELRRIVGYELLGLLLDFPSFTHVPRARPGLQCPRCVSTYLCFHVVGLLSTQVLSFIHNCLHLSAICEWRYIYRIAFITDSTLSLSLLRSLCHLR
jgi:hypothetical protein